MFMLSKCFPVARTALTCKVEDKQAWFTHCINNTHWTPNEDDKAAGTGVADYIDERYRRFRRFGSHHYLLLN